MNSSSNHFDYIIAGGGMAGLSLAFYLTKSPLLKTKNILVLDKEPKTQNDRTWCFWEATQGPFEEIIHRKWDAVWFGNEAGQLRALAIAPYKYKMLRGIDFYRFILNQLAATTIQIRYEAITDITSTHEVATVTTLDNTYTAHYIFDSLTPLDLKKPFRHHLLQHFKGYVIQTPHASFEENKAVMMNFGIPQAGDCRFMYVLPLSASTALVEYTLFNETLLQPQQYDEALKQYIAKSLGITTYQIIEEEFGIIPMSDTPVEQFPSPRVMRIGTAGGATHPATGYTFTSTQHQLQQIVEQLEKTGKLPTVAIGIKPRHRLYASILLNVLHHRRYKAARFFDELYSKNSPPSVFKFLDTQTSFWQELRLMSTTPIFIFIAATVDVLKKRWQERSPL